jgi:hypothetical protein
MFARLRPRIEPAVPFPRIGVVRIADALGNRPDMNIAVTNVPAFMAVVCGSAAGEGGHAASLVRRGANWLDPSLLNHARKVRDRFFVDDRWVWRAANKIRIWRLK